MSTAAPATRRRPARPAGHPADAPAAFTRQPAAPAPADIPVITTARGPAVHVPMSELVIPGVVLGRAIRMPTGVPPWPLILIEGYEKSGKAQPLDARIVTPDGWTTMGELEIGSRVIGSDGRPTTVTAVYERGERDIYRLTFSDGAQVEACDEHLWATWTSSNLHSRYNKGPKKGQRNHRPPVIHTTAEVRDLILAGQVIHIPMTAAVEYGRSGELAISPYALGLLLGDGCLAKPSYPTFTSGDPELFAALAAQLPGHDSLTHPSPQAITVGIKGHATTVILRKMGLMGVKSGGKFIPAEYMTASAGERLALLQGLMDTDGGMEDKSITYTTVSRRLADQVQEIARSLGGSCSMLTKQPSYMNDAGVRVECQLAYRLTMRLPLGMCPFRLGRKVQQWNATRPGYSTPPRRTVRAVEYVGRMPARCIAVAAADHLYLTDHFIVTHNTWAAVLASASPGISGTYWLDLSEGAADEYGAIPGADYRILQHDGSFNDVLAATDELDRWGEAVLDAGKPPICLVVDTVGEIWEWLKDWANDLARSTRKARETLARDPNADITISPAHWNMANARFNAWLRRLKRFHGIVILLAQGKEVAVIKNGKPVEGEKEHKVEAQKSLPAAVNLWLRLYRDKPGEIIGGRSVALDMRPGSGPKPLDEDWTVHNLVFNLLGCEVGKSQVRQITNPKPDAVLPQQIADEACDPTTTLDRMHALRGLVLGSGYEDITVDNERGQEELLLALVDRFGKAKHAATAALEAGDTDSGEAPAAGEVPAVIDPAIMAVEALTMDPGPDDPGPADDSSDTPDVEPAAELTHDELVASFHARVAHLTAQPQVKPLWQEMKDAVAAGQITRAELDQMGAAIAAKGQEGKKARAAAGQGQAAAA